MFWIVLAAVMCVFLLSLHLLGVIIARKFSLPETMGMEDTYAASLEFGDFTEKQFSSLSFIPFTIQSQFGYPLKGVRINPQREPPAGIVILCHGHRYTWYGTVKFMDIFLKLGFAAVTYHHRFHGNSGGESCSAGYYEKWDLQTVSQWAKQQYPEAPVIGVMGESMGGAVVLEYLPLAEQLDFAIADCPYSSMEELYRVQLSRHSIPRIFHRAVISRADTYLRRHVGFSVSQVSPKDAALRSSVPLLLIHGGEDTFVPTWMSRSIYESRKDRYPTDYYEPSNAGHAECFILNPDAYRKRVREFVTSAVRQPHTSSPRR